MKLWIRQGEASYTYTVRAGQLLLPFLRSLEGEGPVLPDLPCGGVGRCGACRVVLLRGIAEADGRVFYASGDARPREMLLCRMALLSDAQVEFPVPEKPGKHQEQDAFLSEERVFSKGFGIAADIGTTNLKLARVRLSDGKVVAEISRPNEQRSYGADVMSRIVAACDGEEQRLTELLRGQLAREIEGLGGGERLAVAANTTMTSLLCGYPMDGMREHPFRPYCLCPEPENGVVIAPCAGAFIGGDVVAGLSAVLWGKELSLLIDLGTNGELVLGTDEAMLAVSAAAGPAFEEGGSESASGAVNMLAEAYRAGVVDETGLLAEPYFETGWHGLTQDAIRALQLAKSAVRVGLEYLFFEYERRFGVRVSETLSHVYLAGGMGEVSVDACIEIGLLPAELRLRTSFVGNTALLGAIRLLSGNEAYRRMKERAGKIEELELAAWEEFNERYVEQLDLPKKSGRPDGGAAWEGGRV